jgi:hypothetical protein
VGLGTHTRVQVCASEDKHPPKTRLAQRAQRPAALVLNFKLQRHKIAFIGHYPTYGLIYRSLIVSFATDTNMYSYEIQNKKTERPTILLDFHNVETPL